MQALSISLRSLDFIPRALQSAATVGWLWLEQGKGGDPGGTRESRCPPQACMLLSPLPIVGVTPSDRTHLTTS